MANIGSKKSGGVFPINEEWRDYVWRLFKPFDPSKGRGLIYDPFANTGKMLLRGAEMLNLEPYAVELNHQFIPELRENMAQYYLKRGMIDYSLTRALEDDSYHVEASHGGFAIVYVNSPYDDMVIGNADAHTVAGELSNSYTMRQRFELTSLRNFFKYVAHNGYMVWVAYAQHMSRKVIQTFRQNCDEIKVFRFPEPHLDHYTQVCVIGQYLQGHEKAGEADPRATEIEDWFINLGKNPDKILSFDKIYDALETRQTYVYKTIPKLTKIKGAIAFESRRTDQAAIDEMYRRFGAHTSRSFSDDCQPTVEPPLEQPMHKPNKRQMIVNIASGMLDNVELTKNGKHALLRGSVRELYALVDKESEQITDKDGTFTRIHETTMIRPDHHIVLLYEDGSKEDLSGADALKGLIAENGERLLQLFEERYKPFYDMFTHPVWLKILKQLHPGGNSRNNFTPSQRRVIICTIEFLAIQNKEILNAQQGAGKTGFAAVAMICLRLLHLAAIYHAGGKFPQLAADFKISGKELNELLESICERYQVKPEDLTGIPVDQPVIVSVPAIAPKVWMVQELPPLYGGFQMQQLFNATEVDQFMAAAAANTDDSRIYVGVVSYETAKSNEGREPVAVPTYKRSTSLEYQQGQGGYKKVITVKKKPTEPITGAIITNPKGEDMLWNHFTHEGRRKTLDLFVGKEFWGYHAESVTLADGKKDVKVNKTSENRLYSTIVARKLTRDEEQINRNVGYPRYASRQYPLYSEVRTPGSAPKVGNGRADTPLIEKVVPQRIIDQVKYRNEYGRPVKPYIARVVVKSYTLLVPDYAHQKNLIPGEKILDKWLASKGNRYLQDAGRLDSIDKAMRIAKQTHYRVGSGHPELDKLLIKRGVQQYTIGVGNIVVRNPKYPIANYVRRYYEGKVALFVGDELHLCFPGYTKISTPNGTKPIRDIQVGDVVLSREGDKIVERRVVSKFNNGKRDSLLKIVHEGGSFECTPEHHIWANGKYIPANELKPGDVLTTQGIEEFKVLHVVPVEVELQEVYDFEVEETHCYFAEGVLVSNCQKNTTNVAAAFRDLAQSAPLVLGLTGTFYGGKSSSVYALAYSFDQEVRNRYRWTRGAPMRWVEDMGVRKMVEIRDIGDGSSLKSGRRQAPRITEAPGASPMLMRMLAKHTLWFSLADMSDRMPNKSEESYEINFDPDQKALHDAIYATTRDYNAQLIVRGDRSFLAPLYQTNISLPDAMHMSGVVIHNIKGDKGAARAKAADITPKVVCHIPSLGPKLKAKERAALEHLKADLAAGRRVIIILLHTSSRDIQPRWLEIIQENVAGAKPFILKQSVKASERSTYINKMIDDDYNVMITNGGLITTAISINKMSAMYEIEYSPSLYNFAQHTARINRPNQERKDIVYRYFYYGESRFQRNAIESIADKTKAAAVLAGAEGGDLAALMSSEERVQSYQGLLDAIDQNKNKIKSAEEIQAAFSVANFSEKDWSSSAWWVEGDQEEDNGGFYAEQESLVEVEEEAEEEAEEKDAFELI